MGGDSVLFASCTGGGFCPSKQKKSGGDSVRGGGGILSGYLFFSVRRKTFHE